MEEDRERRSGCIIRGSCSCRWHAVQCLVLPGEDNFPSTVSALGSYCRDSSLVIKGTCSLGQGVIIRSF